jgi:hypothetical protein
MSIWALSVRGGGRVRAAQEVPKLFRNPNGSDEQIYRSLEECRMIAFHAMAQEQKTPAAEKQNSAQDPLRQDQKNDTSENQRNTDAMQELVPGGRVLMIVPVHVARQTWHSRNSAWGRYLRSYTVYRNEGKF